MNRPPIWFWIIGGVALIWNAIGVVAYVKQALMSAAEFAALPRVEQQLLATLPSWASAAFAIAVFAGFAASICWLMRKRVTVRLFLVSLVAVIVQSISYFIIAGYIEYIAAHGWLMPALILLFAVGFLVISREAERKGLLH